jgi:polar amino acid transport system permease protein
MMDALLQSFLNWNSLLKTYPLLLQGLGMTAVLAVVAVPLAILAGLAVAIVYSLHIRVLNRLLIAYVDVLRSFPILVLLMLIFYALPFLGIRLNNFVAVTAALVLNYSGYYGEIFRAGIESVPSGQRTAALSLGLTPLGATFHVTLPQAVRNVIAPLAGNTLELVKSTAVADLVSLPELLRSARVAQEHTYDPTPLTVAAIMFFVLLWPLARMVARLERKALARSA